MKKKTKSLIILLIILVFAIVACILAVKLGQKDDKPEQQQETADMIDVVPDTDAVITNISYTNEYGDFSFTLKEDKWIYDADESFPVADNYINAIVGDIANLFAYRDLTDEAGADSEYGFDQPSVILKAAYDDGNVLEFVFGAYNESAMGYYMKHDSKIYVVGQGLYGDCSLALNNMIKSEAIASFDKSMIDSIVINGTEYIDENVISNIMYKYQFVTLHSVADYKNAENFGFDGTENKVTLKYTTTTYEAGEDGSLNPVETKREYSFRFTEKDGTEFLIIDKPEGDVELIYISGGAKALLETPSQETVDEIEPLPEESESV